MKKNLTFEELLAMVLMIACILSIVAAFFMLTAPRAGAQGIICGDYVFPTALPTPAHVCSPRDPGYCDWGGICTVVQNSDFTRVACAFASAANVCAARNFDGRHGTAYYQNQRKACNIQCEAVRGYYFYLPYVAFSR